MAMKTWRIRGNFHTPHGDLTQWEYVPADLIKDGGIRYLVHRRVDGGKGWQLTEYITGLKVCNMDRKSDARAKAHELHDTVARIVQQMWDEEADGMRWHDPIFTEVANGMSDDEYTALMSGTFGKVAQ